MKIYEQSSKPFLTDDDGGFLYEAKIMKTPRLGWLWWFYIIDELSWTNSVALLRRFGCLGMAQRSGTTMINDNLPCKEAGIIGGIIRNKTGDINYQKYG